MRDEHYVAALQETPPYEEYDLAIVSSYGGPPLLTEGVAEKIKNFADSCGKPVIISSPGGKFSRELASAFTKTGMPVFFSPESAVRAAAVLCGGNGRQK